MLGIDAANIIDFHRYMLADHGRTHSYQRAIALTVRPGDVVVDIGTGTGILAFFACQAGAKRVYAIERGPAIELAREVCARNGLQGRVVFLQDQSYHITLPERVDVIICEILGSIALQGGILGLLIDAKNRMLREGGRVIPQSLELSAVPVEAAEIQGGIDLWTKDLYGLNFSSLRPFAVNNYYNFKCDPQSFLSNPQPLGRILFAKMDNAYVKGAASFEITRPGVLHGIAAWLSMGLADGITISNSPSEPNVQWGHAFFPLDAPVAIDIGDRVSVMLSTHDGVEWRWQVRVGNCASREVVGRRTEIKFDHSSFSGFPLSRRNLATVDKPRLSRKGEAEQFLLHLLNGERTMADLGNELAARYTDLFPSPKAASGFVREIITRIS